MTYLTCKDAAFAYDGHMVVSDLNFHVDERDYLCVVGENGSGKSTLIKGLLGLKETAAGEIFTGGGLKPSEIGYLPQQTAVQKDFPADVFEVTLSGRLGSRGLLPFYTRRDKQAALDNLALLGIGDLKHRCYRELSGGQQQRVLLARALCATKKLLLLDEPVTGLDPVATQDLYGAIVDINRAGTAVIMVSHDIRSAIQYASHILHLKNTQVFFGPTQDYLKTDEAKYFLGGSQSA